MYEPNRWEPDHEFKKEFRAKQRREILKQIALFIAYIAAISLVVGTVRMLAELFFS